MSLSEGYFYFCSVLVRGLVGVVFNGVCMYGGGFVSWVGLLCLPNEWIERVGDWGWVSLFTFVCLVEWLRYLFVCFVVFVLSLFYLWKRGESDGWMEVWFLMWCYVMYGDGDGGDGDVRWDEMFGVKDVLSTVGRCWWRLGCAVVEFSGYGENGVGYLGTSLT